MKTGQKGSVSTTQCIRQRYMTHARELAVNGIAKHDFNIYSSSVIKQQQQDISKTQFKTASNALPPLSLAP